MKQLFVSGNYLIVDDKEFPLTNALLNDVALEYHIYDKMHKLPTAYIKKSNFASWYAADGVTAYDATTLLTFLRANTGIGDSLEQTARGVIPDASGFAGILNSADTDLQTVLGKLDGPYVALSADYTVLAADSGTTFLLDAIGEDITLPGVAVVGKWKFMCAVETATTDWTITAATAVIQGSVNVNSTLVPAATESLITLVVAKFLPGDWITIESDGTNFYVNGQVVTAAGCTLTAP